MLQSKYILESQEFHISLICDVSPNCDCHSENDAPIIPNIGMLASFDMVALDKACADLTNAQKPFENSNLGEQLKHISHEKDNFKLITLIQIGKVKLNMEKKSGLDAQNTN